MLVDDLDPFEEGRMNSFDAEERFSVSSDAKLHGGMCKLLSTIVGKVQEIFPFIEASRPRSKSGIQSLCSLHVSIDKAKSLLQHCSDCSKLYLAITGDSILMKFEKARSSLQESLRRVENIVPQDIGCQIMEIVGDLDVIVFELEQSEKQTGNDVISLLQKEGRGRSSPRHAGEVEVFRNAASRLGITSSRAALVERRALKKLIEKTHAQDDKRKESIVSYLLHLMRKYANLFRGEMADDVDSQGSAPCSPTVSENQAGAFESKQSAASFGRLPVSPEELRCPISLQLMYDPVIISSGQTFDRACIEKWFVDGNRTCPKTRQPLPHLGLTPNYCVKGLIASWCEQNGVPVPDAPPEPPDCSSSPPTLLSNNGGRLEVHASQAVEEDELQWYESLLACLSGDASIRQQCEAVEQIRLLLKDDEEARTYMGASGFVEALVRFLRSAVDESDELAQRTASMALFNLALNNNRNKESLLSCGAIPLLEKMIYNHWTQDAAIELIFNLSFLEQAKPVIGCSYAAPFLLQSLQLDNLTTCKHDALSTLHNLSTHPSNNQPLLDSGIVDTLLPLLASNNGDDDEAFVACAETVLSIFINMASSPAGKLQMMSTPGLISALAFVLDTGELAEQELAVACLLVLCHGDYRCSDMVLREGVIPSLVSVSVSGTPNGRDKAGRLLKVFREQRQRETAAFQLLQLEETGHCHGHGHGHGHGQECAAIPDAKPSCKSRSKQHGRTLSAMWKNRTFSVYQC